MRTTYTHRVPRSNQQRTSPHAARTFLVGWWGWGFGIQHSTLVHQRRSVL